jgi:hypothetical protein
MKASQGVGGSDLNGRLLERNPRFQGWFMTLKSSERVVEKGVN